MKTLRILALFFFCSCLIHCLGFDQSKNNVIDEPTESTVPTTTSTSTTSSVVTVYRNAIATDDENLGVFVEGKNLGTAKEAYLIENEKQYPCSVTKLNETTIFVTFPSTIPEGFYILKIVLPVGEAFTQFYLTKTIIPKDGLNCWDLNTNGIQDLEEDITGDGIWDTADCKGIDGQNGQDGSNGTNGKDGTNGVDGQNGQDGINGQDGENGENGEDGADGNDGKDGTDGTNGQNGETLYLVDKGNCTAGIIIDPTWTVYNEDDEALFSISTSNLDVPAKNIYFTSSDCTGTSYIETNYVVRSGEKKYYKPQNYTPQALTAKSRIKLGTGGCETVSLGKSYYEASVFTPSCTFPLSNPTIEIITQ